MSRAAAAPADLPPSVTLTEGEGGLEVLRVSTAACTGEVYLHGAHLTSWIPTGQDPVIWMSRASQFAPGRPIRGGVPVCFPWFGPGRTGDLAPAHGFARLARWTLLAAEDDGESVRLTFRLTDADVAGLPGVSAWPQRFELTYTITLGHDLELALTVRNTGEHPAAVEEALHTYLHVRDVTATTVTGLDGAPYADKVGAPGRHHQQGPVTFTAETDRVYHATGAVEVHDPAAARILVVAKDGSADTVVWNPWTAKAAAMPDYDDAEWPTMVCVETANVLDSALTLAPGATHTMTARLSSTTAG